MNTDPSAEQADKLYAEARAEEPSAFRFDAKVAAVFPDMIQRSVPGYALILNMLPLLAARYAQDGSRVYDLGCSLGAASSALRRGITRNGCCVVAVDNSPAMLEKCRANLAAEKSRTAVEIYQADICDFEIYRASIVVLNFTLQFIPPRRRLALLRRIYQGLLPGGVLLISEKLAFSEQKIQEELTELHHAFKRANGYTELEISRKRSALENVLIADTLSRHKRRLRAAGFAHSGVWLQCFNFVSLLAWK